MEKYIYIIISLSYAHWSDNNLFKIAYISESLEKAKAKFEKYKKVCAESSEDDKYVYEYALYRYKLEGNHYDRKVLDRCSNTEEK